MKLKDGSLWVRHMKNKVLVCDVDGVVVDMSRQWHQYLINYAYHYDPLANFPTYEEVCKYYNFGEAFSDWVCMQDCLEFWKQSNLYDKAIPTEGAVEFIYTFKGAGWDIVFASHCEGTHSKSKWEFLNRHFPVDGFMATREKQYVRADIAIDDRIEHLTSRNDKETLLVWKLTPHVQTQDEETLGLLHYESLGELSTESARHLIHTWERYYGHCDDRGSSL